jgi:hypothetical protein
MDKAQFLKQVYEHLLTELSVLKETARITAEAATHEESKPENQYDTRGLEASYLAGAQSKRIVDTEELVQLFKHAQAKSFKSSDPIQATALVQVSLDGHSSFYFIMPKGGGIQLEFGGRKIQVITPVSPLGEALVGLTVGQWATVEKGQQTFEYEVISVE